MILLNIEQEINGLAHQYLRKVKPSGPNNVMAVCPFHKKLDGTEEQNPSFAMNTSNGLYFCHACGTKGNLYTFLRDLGISRDDISFKYGTLVEAASNNVPPKLDVLDPHIAEEDPIPEYLLGMFEMCPTSLVQDGFAPETLRNFDVGFDLTHNRITYPLRDFHGKLAGISGRDVTGEHVRYKVYDREYQVWGLPQRLQPEKRRLLWNVHTIYPELYFNPGDHDVVVVEGFKACMWVWQAGIRNVVALLGTYMSDEQQLLLERLGATIYLFLDYNAAGLKGTGNIIHKLKQSSRIRVMRYPDRIVQHAHEAQPDSLTVEEVLAAKAQAVNHVSWLYSLN